MSKKIDLVSKRFGRLVVVEAVPSKDGRTLWRCLCDCGAYTAVDAGNLKSKTGSGTKSCGCLSRDTARSTMSQLQLSIRDKSESEMVGKTFYRLTVVSLFDVEPNRCRRWNAICACGNTVIVRTNALIHGKTKSCGCWRSDSRLLAGDRAMFNHLLAIYKAAAKRREYEWGLTNEQFEELTRGDCHYCGRTPQPRNCKSRVCVDYVCNGVDRKDSSVGYHPENCVPACKVCNHAKGTMAYKEFIDYLATAGRFQLGLTHKIAA